MKATALEFRLRFLIHGIIYVIGFTAPWDYALHLDSIRTWQWLAAWSSRTGWFGFSGATTAVLALGIVLALAAALLRTWATAYMGASIVKSAAMHGDRIVADGPYRFLRNPLYVGLFLNTLALALLMPPTGAAFCIVILGFFELRLIAAEESFLTAQKGEPYLAYCARVPRVLPALTPRLPASGARAHWLTALLGEIYFWGAFISFASLGWGYNAVRIVQGVLISLGLSIIVRAFLPKAVSPPLPSE